MKTLIGVKHMQYPDKKCLQHTSEIDETFWTNICNMPLKHLQHAFETLVTYATPRTTFAIFIQNTCNIPLKHLKHLKHTFASYMRGDRGRLIPASGHEHHQYGSCNTPGVYHQLSSGFKLKHDRLVEMMMPKSNL
jgi:hypothetical protein